MQFFTPASLREVQVCLREAANAYFAILLTHSVLAMGVLPSFFLTVFRPVRMRWTAIAASHDGRCDLVLRLRHGVVIYWMLYHM